MKCFRVIILAAVAFVAVGAATKVNAQAGLGVRVGFSQSTLRGDEGSSLNGGSIGVAYELPVTMDGRLTFRPGVAYTFAMSSKEYKSGFYQPNGLVSKIAKTNHTVGVPLHFKYAFPMGERAEFYLFAGPQVHIGIKYNIEYTFTPDLSYESPFITNYNGTLTRDLYSGKVTTDIEDSEELVETYENGTSLSRFDIAVGGGVGFKFGHVFLEAGYDYGLLNINKTSGQKTGHDQLNVSVGYSF